MFRVFFPKACRGFVALVSLACLVSVAHAEDKSMWQKFVDFFSPTSEVEGDGPLYDELRELDRKIHRIEGKYARERRPMNKDRYKKELAQLKNDREELLKKIEAQKANGSSAQTASSSSMPASSSAKVVSSSSMPLSSSEMVSSSSQMESSSSESVPVADSTTVLASAADSSVVCRPDTVYIRDTVVVHDTLYVMLAPKPEPAAEKAPAASAK